MQDLVDYPQQVGQNSKTVFIKFFATWCKPCKLMAPIMELLESENPEIEFLQVDVDQSLKLVDLLNIKGVPTVVVLKNGTETGRLVGLKLQAMYQEIINGASIEAKHASDTGG